MVSALPPPPTNLITLTNLVIFDETNLVKIFLMKVSYLFKDQPTLTDGITTYKKE